MTRFRLKGVFSVGHAGTLAPQRRYYRGAHASTKAGVPRHYDPSTINVLRLHPDGGGSAITIEHAIVRVGRDSSCDVHLRDASVSRIHAEIELRGEEWVVVDQNRGNGIRVDGRRVEQAVLPPGQQLHIGNLKFRVEIDRGNDGATMMLGRSPLLEDPSDGTMMGAPPAFPVERKPRSNDR